MAATYPRKTMAPTRTVTRRFTMMRFVEMPPIVNSKGIFVGSATDPKRYDKRPPRIIPVAVAIRKMLSGRNLSIYNLYRF